LSQQKDQTSDFENFSDDAYILPGKDNLATIEMSDSDRFEPGSKFWQCHAGLVKRSKNVNEKH